MQGQITATNSNDADALALAMKLCQEADAILLFLTRFGSALYGTSLPGKSDRDVRGLFLPSLASLAVRKAKDTIRFSTGSDRQRNGAQDLDIDIWSLQHWLLKLLPEGDIGAIDLLFSPSHKKCVLLQSPLLAPIFAQPCRLLNLGDGSGCCRYAIAQARKYGIRGSRLGSLKQAFNFVARLDARQRLAQVMDAIIQTCQDAGHCCAVENAQGRALNIGGKLFPATLRIGEFRNRLEYELKRYEECLDKIDFKALSHAIRAANQMEELLLTGKIVFPLQSREELIRIKTGQYSWQELEGLILARLERIRQLCKNATSDWDSGFAERAILKCYEAELNRNPYLSQTNYSISALL